MDAKAREEKTFNRRSTKIYADKFTEDRKGHKGEISYRRLRRLD
jgi:hypothetical protein